MANSKIDTRLGGFAWVFGIIGLVGIGLSVIGYAYWGHISWTKVDAEQMQGFGGLIGGLFGTLFMVATTILVWLTYKSQKEELEETRTIIRKQRFEGTFFNLLQVQNQIRNSMNFGLDNLITYYQGERPYQIYSVSGLQFFETAKDDFGRYYISRPELISPRIVCRELNNLDSSEAPDVNDPLPRIKYKWKRFFDVYHNQLSHYFRHLYYVIAFVDQAQEDDLREFPDDADNIKNRYQFYAGMIQAQMSSSELYLFFYNGLCFVQVETLIKKYFLVENLAFEDLADPELHKDLYGENFLKSRSTISET